MSEETKETQESVCERLPYAVSADADYEVVLFDDYAEAEEYSEGWEGSKIKPTEKFLPGNTSYNFRDGSKKDCPYIDFDE